MNIIFFVFSEMTVWNERDFNIAILYWKGKITLKEALESNPMIPASSWNLQKLQYEQIYNKTRIRGNDLKPIGRLYLRNIYKMRIII